jgi:DNA repair photolyase
VRWKVEEEEAAQGALFPDVERHVGRGEFRGMEFLHVRARTIINSLPSSSRLPFRHTINAYRGCSHACTYCAWGGTPVLMADGRTRALAHLRIGDRIVGTEVVGRYRRYVPTTVLDHWSVVRPVWRTVLDDGTVLMTSGDHRFLSDRGWKHVGGGPCRGPLLTDGDGLLGPDGWFAGPDRSVTLAAHGAVGVTERLSLLGRAVKNSPTRAVASVEPLGMNLPLYDITTGTGDYVAEGVISHNCFARPTHDYLGLDIDEGFERQVVVKVNAVERLRAELDPRRWCGEPIAMGTNTDPYQRAEGKYHLTRGLVEVLGQARNPFSILTKSTLVLRDADVLAEAAARTDVTVSFSVGTLDEEVWRATEPGTPPPRKRLEALTRLRDAGLTCGVLVAPVLPGLSDSAASLDAVVAAATEAGASSVSGGMVVYLKPGVREVFLSHLSRTHPELVPRYEAMYRGVNAPAAERRRVAELLREAQSRHRGRALTPPSRPAPHRNAPPPRPSSPAGPAPVQLGLGV